MPKKVVVKISRKGKIEASVEGVKGEGCKQLTKFLEKMSVVETINETEEFFETPDEEVASEYQS